MLRSLVGSEMCIRDRAEMVLPHSWDIALTVLEALDNGRDPVEDAVNKYLEGCIADMRYELVVATDFIGFCGYLLFLAVYC